MRKPKYIAVNGCDKCHLGYVYYICNKCDGMGCLYCRNGEVVEACECNKHPYEIDFEIPEGRE